MTQTCNCGQPTSGAWLCGDCELTLRWALVNVAAYHQDLETVAAKRVRYGTTGATKGSIGKTQPLVVDLRFTGTTDAGTQLRYDTWATVVAWCRTVMEEQAEFTGPVCRECIHVSCAAIKRRRRPRRNTIASMCEYLARQFSYILREQWAPAFYDEMLDIERRLSWMVNRPPDRWYAGRCSATDESGNHCKVELYATKQRGVITCPGCDTQHQVEARREFLLAEAKDHLVTASEAAGALIAWTDYDGTEKRLIDRIARWREGRLETRGTAIVNGQERVLYRLGDVQELMIEHAQREQHKRLRVS